MELPACKPVPKRHQHRLSEAGKPGILLCGPGMGANLPKSRMQFCRRFPPLQPPSPCAYLLVRKGKALLGGETISKNFKPPNSSLPPTPSWLGLPLAGFDFSGTYITCELPGITSVM